MFACLEVSLKMILHIEQIEHMTMVFRIGVLCGFFQFSQ